MKIRVIGYLLFAFFLVACQSNSGPKPRGYYRIDLPEKNYVELAKDYPFTFVFPEYSEINKYEGVNREGEDTDNWLNIDFPSFGAHLYLTYKPVSNNLGDLIEDSHSFVYKHVSVADGIEQVTFINEEESVYGLLFDIKGNAATSLQFYLTDSISRFMRGALYFDCEPNRDSLAPLIKFLRRDIEVLMENFTWI